MVVGDHPLCFKNVLHVDPECEDEIEGESRVKIQEACMYRCLYMCGRI